MPTTKTPAKKSAKSKAKTAGPNAASLQSSRSAKSVKRSGSPVESAATYAARKIRENNKSRKQAEDKREIGVIPPPKNPERRASCERDFGLFLKTYFPGDTRHPWSTVHVKLIEAIQIVVLVGAMLAMGIPRGWGKTFISVRAIMWACAYRHHTMCMLIAASDSAAADLIQDIRDELENNPLLREDFPEMCLPIAALEGINQRGKGQTSGNVATRVKADAYELHLGDLGDKPGAVIYAGGITGSKIRGRRKKRGDRIERPTLGLIDDFQTRASARSKMQIETRLNIVSDDIPGLPGNDQAWSCLLTCTVIEPGDGADQLLDRSQHPDWRGIRASFLDSLPDEDALDLWEQWNQIRVEDLQTFDDDVDDVEQESISERAHDFYRANFEAMNSGCVVAWEYAFKPEHYVDALEKAMHWYFRSRRGFWSELQNQPEKFHATTAPTLQAHQLAVRWSHLERGIVPSEADYLTAHADVSKNVLWYEIRAFAQDSTSWTIEYGTWPKQSRAYFTQATAANTIDLMYSQLPTWHVRAMAAIRDLFTELFSRQFMREDGTVQRLTIAGIDANDETETVKEAIRKANLSGRLWPMHSRSFRAPKPPLNDLSKKDGDIIGDNWRHRTPAHGSMRYITYDTDRWKSHHRDRLIVPAETPGSITFYGGTEHRMLADQSTAEFSSVNVNMATGRTEEWWANRPGQDNHLWDVGVGNDVLGSRLGCRIPASMILNGRPEVTTRRKKRRKMNIKF